LKNEYDFIDELKDDEYKGMYLEMIAKEYVMLLI